MGLTRLRIDKTKTIRESYRLTERMLPQDPRPLQEWEIILQHALKEVERLRTNVKLDAPAEELKKNIPRILNQLALITVSAGRAMGDIIDVINESQ